MLRKFIYEVEPLLDGTDNWGVFAYDVDDPAYANVVFEGTKEAAEQHVTALDVARRLRKTV